MDKIPQQVFTPELQKRLRTLDLSKNNLTSLEKLSTLTELKSLNLDDNKLRAGSLTPVGSLSKLQNLSVAGNLLGKPVPQSQQQPDVLPSLPTCLKQISLAANHLASVPRQLLSPTLVKLEKVDLSKNNLASVPEEISNLANLLELNLDGNMIVALPEKIGELRKLKVLSLRDNQILVTSTIFTEKNPQPLPKALFEETALIDLNLHGNPMTTTQLNEFDGFQTFLDRRQKVKSKTLVNLSVCGLK